MTAKTTYLADFALRPLKAWTHDGTVGQGVPLVPGVYFSWGKQADAVSGAVTAQPENLFSAQFSVNEAPDWFTLNIELGTTDFHNGDVIGIVVDIEGLPDTELPFSIRSAYEGGLFDTTLSDGLVGSTSRVVRTALHTVGQQDALTRWGGFHTLMIELPRHDCALALHDMRIFLIPGSAGLRSGPITFGDAGG